MNVRLLLDLQATLEGLEEAEFIAICDDVGIPLSNESKAAPRMAQVMGVIIYLNGRGRLEDLLDTLCRRQIPRVHSTK